MGEGRFTLSGIALVLGAIALGLMFSPNADVAAFGNILTFLTIILLILSLISRNNSSVSLILAIILCVVNLFKYDNYKTQHAELLRAIEEANLKKYTISFDTDGGSEINPMVVSANTYLENNNIPEKAGYVFECWTLNGSVFDFSGKVDNRITSDITLKANYSIDLSNPNITVTTESHGSTESGLINNKKKEEKVVQNNSSVQTQQQSTQQPQSTPQPEPSQNVTLGMKNALQKAKRYLNSSAFSREGLIDQLEFEKYSTEEANYAVDNCGANWKEQAVKKAKRYLNSSAFSREGLIEQLEFEKYSAEEAQYGVENCGANWKEQAVKKAKSYLKHSSFSREGLINQLEFEKFTREEAEYGATGAGY